MKITQAGVQSALTYIASVAATVLPLLVEQHVITAQLGAIVGGIVTAVVGGWHGNNGVAKLQAAKAAKVTP